MIYIVTKCAEIHIVFNKNDQAIYLNLFELIEDQVTKDGCSKLSMSVDWNKKRLEIHLYDYCYDDSGHDEFDSLNYDVLIPILAEHLQVLLSNYDVTITQEIW